MARGSQKGHFTLKLVEMTPKRVHGTPKTVISDIPGPHFPTSAHCFLTPPDVTFHHFGVLAILVFLPFLVFLLKLTILVFSVFLVFWCFWVLW